MTLKYQVESLEGIDETARGLYAEAGDGKGYVLQVEGVVSQSKFNEVNQRAVDAAEEARRRRATVERVTGKLGLETADGLDEALEALLSKSKAPAKPDPDQEAVVQQIKAQAEADKKALTDQLTGIRTDAAKSQFTAALMASGFGEKVADMIANSNMNRVQFDETGKMRIMQANGSPLAGSGADGFATVGDLASELAAAMPELLTDQGKGGGGKPPASGSQGGAKTVTRSQFDAMSQTERADFFKSGGKVTD
jgi:hypothetical protein